MTKLTRALPKCSAFIYLFFYVTFNTVQVKSRWVVGRAEETSTFSWLGFCTANCRLTASNYQLSNLRPCREPNPSLRGGRRECYHSATVAPRSAVQESKPVYGTRKFRCIIINSINDNNGQSLYWRHNWLKVNKINSKISVKLKVSRLTIIPGNQ